MTDQDVAALILGGALPEKVEPVCLALDLAVEYEALQAELAGEAERNADSLSGGRSAELRAQLGDLKCRMQAATVPFRFRALPAPKFKALKREHPPRKAEDGTVVVRDGLLEVNEDTFFEPLLRASLVEPILDDATFRVLVDERLTDAQLERLTTICWHLNVRTVDVPF